MHPLHDYVAKQLADRLELRAAVEPLEVDSPDLLHASGSPRSGSRERGRRPLPVRRLDTQPEMAAFSGKGR